MAPAAGPSWFRRTREAFQGSVWAPVALRLAGLALGILVLSGIGVASILSGASGVEVPLAGMLGSDVHGGWLANQPVPSANPAAKGASLAPHSAPNTRGIAAETAAGATAPNGDAANPAPGAANQPNSAGMTVDGKVILNLATIADLRHLPGVGQKRADLILALRARLGHFKHVNDLLRVKGIGVRGLKKIAPHVVLDAPVAPMT
ncbi:MAG TPA: helix-hairpin-helix domain-containing protein [Polyangiaceae bacterium]|jgi:competence protein ComEA